MALKDMAGMRVGRLSVLRRGENGPKHQTQWVCVCDCDPTREVLMQSGGMVSGRTRSCGCLQREARATSRVTHGRTRSREYHSWSGAKNRCSNRLNGKWHLYGGRGITMCRRWRESFEAFLSDMGDAPPQTSIDRADNDGHYSCGKCDDCADRGLTANCRWATYKEQARNQRRNVSLTIGEETATMVEWSERTGIDYDAIRARVQSGVAGGDIIDPADRTPTRVIVGPDGTALRLSEWARRSGISAVTILWRIKNGWSEALAASTPKTHKFRPAERKQ